jgi:DNA-binding response OmpR family regulator
VTYSILIIGDDPSLRSELVSTLHQAGFAVASVPDYPETLFKQNGVKPDLVIMDEALPNLDAMEACYELENTFGIPVILLGEDSTDEAWRRVMEADASLYLLKPVRHQELIARVKAILRRFHQVPGGRDSRWRKREVDDMKGLTAIEILIAVAIVILLAVVVVPRLMEVIGG